MCQKDNEAGVTLTLLKDISDEELKEAIPKLGLRMKFKRELAVWKQQNNTFQPDVQKKSME
ncbi:uncharacterized protein [Drosophila takahashii]|uniref:uncharacterized protein isoform X4 n=1 Tax=Drosophila takahashii TaxID=29030 RepID=UPI00389929DF